MPNFASMQGDIRGFIGPIPQKGKRIHILGVGISGLLLGWHLKKAGFEVSLFSDSSKTGGLIHSEQRAFGMVESAANAVVWSKHLEQLCAEIGLSPLAANKKASKRFILREGRFRTFPLNTLETLRLLISLFQKFPLSKDEDFETLAKRVGGDALLNYLVQPGLYGIYASEAKFLGVNTLFPGFAQSLNENKSLWEALKSVFPSRAPGGIRKGLHSFEQGMMSLTDALAQELRQNIHPINELPAPDEHSHLISCAPAYATLPAFIPEYLKSFLEKVEYAPLISSTFFFRSDEFTHLPQGFGCVIPPSEGLSILGILFNDQIFDHRVVSSEYRSFTCISGGYGRPSLTLDYPEQGWKEIILQDFLKATNCKALPVDCIHQVWPKALPVYQPAMPALWDSLHQACLSLDFPFSLFSNFTGEISIRGLCGTAAIVSERACRG